MCEPLQGDNCTVEVLSGHDIHDNGGISPLDSYQLRFVHSVDFTEGYEIVSGVAGRFEEFYQKLVSWHGAYHRNFGREDTRASIKDQVRDIAMELNFEKEDAEDFADFVLSIKPTYGQLLAWESELSRMSDQESERLTSNLRSQIERIDHFSKKAINPQQKQTLRRAIMEDTYKHPSQYETIEQTWPVHFSGCYLFQEVRAGQHTATFNKLQLFPAVVSKAASPEKILGAELERASERTR